MTKNIAILTGGISSERPVALRSSANMADWVKIAGYDVTLFDFPKDIEVFLSQYKMYDLVIPVFHGKYGEDGQITAFLKTLDCQYASCHFETHALCMDKNLTNLLVATLGVKVPKSLLIKEDASFEGNMIEEFHFPLIVKPNTGGSSIATTKTQNHNETMEAVRKIQSDDTLIQECIEGREFTVGVYNDTDGYKSLPIMEIVSLKKAFFDYEEKYESDGSNEVFLEGEEEIQKILRQESLRIAEFLDIRGVVRIDWRYDGKDFYFLEVNTIPGFTSASFIPKMWKKAGKTEKEFVDMMMT